MKDRKTTAVTEKDTSPLANEARAGRAGDAAENGPPVDLDLTLEQEMEELREQLQEQQQIAAEAQDNFLRARADIDNYRRRARQEMEDVRRYGVEQIVTNLLPVLDDLERALDAAESSENAAALREGVSLIYNKLRDVLAKVGVEPITAVGESFDPALHEAIMRVEGQPGQPADTVVEELRRGYRLNDRVIRASMVKVAA
jgi:molecular chaperone GrpE